MKHILLDNNVIVDCIAGKRGLIFPDSVKALVKAKESACEVYISSSSLDNVAFILYREMHDEFGRSLTRKQLGKLIALAIQTILKQVKIAKTPSYINIDYEDIEDSQVIASAETVDAVVLTRYQGMHEKYPQVTLTPSDYLVTENQSTFIPIGQTHSLENTGVIPLELIEVQSGSYLGEDDIVRFEDRYGRK